MEKINIAELLKDCPKGMELDCLLCDNVVFEKIEFNSDRYPIIINILKTNTTFYLSKYGQFSDEEGYKCVIFPKGKTTWEGFVPPCKFKDGDIVATSNGDYVFLLKKVTSSTANNIYYGRCYFGITLKSELLLEKEDNWYFTRLATEEEKQKLFDIIKTKGYKWDTEAKTLKKLIEPKFKVGDKVIYEDKRREITKMVWEESTNTVAYKLDDKLYCNVIDALQPYKEETMEEKLMPRIDLTGYCKDKYIIALGNYKIQEENGVTYAIRKKPQYPKTYKECCDVLGLSTMDNDAKGYKGDLIIRFQELLIARDAYWKIACEQMGLGKSWEPDYKNPDIDLYVIINIYNRAEKATYGYGFQQCILTFPTKEMRDAFYENFKELIKECISLL